MPFVIGASCVDITDMACVEVCPVDCIYEGDRKLYIQPDECIDCGACETECPQSAIFPAVAPISGQEDHIADNGAFFLDLLPGRAAALGSPGGAQDLGRVGVDTALVQQIHAG